MVTRMPTSWSYYLKRRRVTAQSFIEGSKISSYSSLVKRMKHEGIEPPSPEETYHLFSFQEGEKSDTLPATPEVPKITEPTTPNRVSIKPSLGKKMVIDKGSDRSGLSRNSAIKRGSSRREDVSKDPEPDPDSEVSRVPIHGKGLSKTKPTGKNVVKTQKPASKTKRKKTTTPKVRKPSTKNK